jgi:DNA polymerase V
MRPLKLHRTDSLLIPFVGNKLVAGFPSPALDYIQDPIDLNAFLINHPDATYQKRKHHHWLAVQKIKEERNK